MSIFNPPESDILLSTRAYFCSIRRIF